MSQNENRTCVRAGIDEELDKLREDYAGEVLNGPWLTAGLEPLLVISFRELGANVQNQMSLIMSRNTPPGLCEDVKVIYLPQLGCLVAVSGMYHRELVPPDWQEQVSFGVQ